MNLVKVFPSLPSRDSRAELSSWSRRSLETCLGVFGQEALNRREKDRPTWDLKTASGIQRNNCFLCRLVWFSLYKHASAGQTSLNPDEGLSSRRRGQRHPFDSLRTSFRVLSNGLSVSVSVSVSGLELDFVGSKSEVQPRHLADAFCLSVDGDVIAPSIFVPTCIKSGYNRESHRPGP